MAKKRFKITAWILLLMVTVFFVIPETVIAEGTGNLKGFIYKKKGKKPRWGVQVLLKNKETGQVFESNVTDAMGDYVVKDVPAGDYQILLLVKDKSYKIKKVDFQVKIFDGKTSSLSFALKKPGKFLFFFLSCDIIAILAAAVAIIL